MIFKNTTYIVTVDGFFEGITENEHEIADIVADATNGVTSPVLDDDYCDRVFVDEINTNRFVADRQSVTDKLSDDTILCYNTDECNNAVEQLNALNLQRLRLEAKIRAENL